MTVTFGDGLAIPGDGIDEEAAEAGEQPGAQPPGVVVVRFRAARRDHGGDAVLTAGVQGHPVHRVVAGAARPEVEICGRGEQARAVRRGYGEGEDGEGGRGRLAVGVLEGEVVADEPAAGGAKDDDVAAGGHGGDDAVPPRGVALQGIGGEQLTAGGVHGRELVRADASSDSGGRTAVSRRRGRAHRRRGPLAEGVS
jgi:hypothetical protein